MSRPQPRGGVLSGCREQTQGRSVRHWSSQRGGSSALPRFPVGSAVARRQDRSALGGAPALQDRTPEIAGQWRPEPGVIAGNPGIILRQRWQAICKVVMIGAVEFVRRALTLLFSAHRPRRRYEQQGNAVPPEQDFSGKPRDPGCSARRRKPALSCGGGVPIRAEASFGPCPSRSPPIVPDNSHLLLLLSAEAQLSRGEQTVDNESFL